MLLNDEQEGSTPAQAGAMPGKLIPTRERGDQREHDLQDLFVTWNKSPPARAMIAGRPRPIVFDGDPHKECMHSAWGYRPRVDIVGDTGDGRKLIVELKLGSKYEPLGLAEVLFHAERLDKPEHPAHPVLVTQYNLWNRVVIDALHRRSGKRILDYYEVTVVEVDDAPCFWFDAPLSPWRSIANPGDQIAALAKGVADAAFADAAWLQGALHWYKIDDTDTYVAITTPRNDRPPVIDVPYLMLAPIEDSMLRWMAWAGVPPATDAATTRWSLNRYWVCSL